MCVLWVSRSGLLTAGSLNLRHFLPPFLCARGSGVGGDVTSECLRICGGGGGVPVLGLVYVWVSRWREAVEGGQHKEMFIYYFCYTVLQRRMPM